MAPVAITASLGRPVAGRAGQSTDDFAALGKKCGLLLAITFSKGATILGWSVPHSQEVRQGMFDVPKGLRCRRVNVEGRFLACTFTMGCAHKGSFSVYQRRCNPGDSYPEFDWGFVISHQSKQKLQRRSRR